MSTFNTNFQFNVAQMNSLSNIQEKNKKVSENQQEKIARKEEKTQEIFHESVNPAIANENSNKVHEESKQEESAQEINKKKPTDKEEEKNIENIVVYKDDNKGKIIDFLG